MQITAVILAGGRGMRMGGADKGLVSYQGRPMVAHVLARIQPQVDHVIINANRNLDQYQDFGLPVVADANDQFDGPLAGMQAGLHHATTDWVLSVPCDSPLLPLDLVSRLRRAIEQASAIHHTPTMLAIARSASGTHPVFCLMPRQLRADLDAFLQQGQRKVSAWQAEHPHVFVSFEDEQAFTNINQPPASLP
ncbi:molybdenum cofactor guanylyltransferase MobA [Methylophilus sp. 5]|uniref:molybdenum cofactor guanylyltransferase MobA n=1 Tax=Methylophilus sp. 5 TaxID=1112274 RepID=UPI00048C39A7|nr:molybdenum cofactor guanylyltransferase MobA [Methylophilus sp. 5]